MNKKRKISQNPERAIVGERSVFPRPICLELCDLSITKGFERDVIKTLKAFSNEQEFQSKTPHPLHKSPELEKYFSKSNKKIFSLDVKSRVDAKRLFYFVDEKNVCKILALCSEESH